MEKVWIISAFFATAVLPKLHHAACYHLFAWEACNLDNDIKLNMYLLKNNLINLVQNERKLKQDSCSVVLVLVEAQHEVKFWLWISE